MDNKDITAWAKDFYARLKKIETSENAAMEPATIMAELEKAFPELKESEDEKTRKEILDWMRGGTTYDWQENKEKWVAWIEKQKEQKPAEWSEEDEGMYELFYYVIELVEDCPDKERVKNWIKEIKERFINSDYRSVGLHYILKNNHKYWKPSEEDLTALEYCAEHTCPELLSLYLELKKL